MASFNIKFSEFLANAVTYFLRLIEEYIISLTPPPPHPSLRPIEGQPKPMGPCLAYGALT